MPEVGNALSRNPNVCASCSSMVDGMEGAGVSGLADEEADATLPPERLTDSPPATTPGKKATEVAAAVRR
jgi:hypothetical protein